MYESKDLHHIHYGLLNYTNDDSSSKQISMRNSSNTQSLGAHFKGDSPNFKSKYTSKFVGEMLGPVKQEPGEDRTNSSS